MDEEFCLIRGSKYRSGDGYCQEKECYECDRGTWQLRFIDRTFGVGP